MNPAPRRRLGWKILGGIVAALAGVAGGVAIWTSIVADRRVAAMVNELGALRKEIEKRDPTHPPLRGEPLEGNAWEDYPQAFAALPGVSRDNLRKLYVEKSILSVYRNAAMIDGGELAFVHLRRGTRRRHGAYPYVWEEGVTLTVPSSDHCSSLAYLAALRSRSMLAQGRAREAAELMLDTLRFSEDLGTGAPIMLQWTSHVVGAIGLDELKAILASPALGREDLLSIERQLELLVRARPELSDGADTEVLLSGYELLKPPARRDSLFCATFADSWRFAFSRRIAEVDAFDQSLIMARELMGMARMAWPEANALSTDLQERTHENKNPLVPQLLAWSRNNSDIDRERRAHFEMLRVAARFRATGEILTLDDPFGGKLRTELNGDDLRIWSVGPGGKDDGGAGEWKRGWKDIVLEVNR
jgi:hypothetical protein